MKKQPTGWFTNKNGKKVLLFIDYEPNKDRQLKSQKEAANKLTNEQKYHKFKDEPKSVEKPDRTLIGYYDGDGYDVQEFFADNSNYDKIAEEIYLNEQDREVFESWAFGIFMSEQERYTDKFSSLSQLMQRSIKILDKYIDKSIITEGISLHRNAGFELISQSGKPLGLDEIKELKGTIITTTGHISTSAAARGLDIQTRKPVDYEIKIPANSKGAALFIGDPRIQEFQGNDQREVIVNRNCLFEIGDAKIVDDKIHVELIYIGREEHTYD